MNYLLGFYKRSLTVKWNQYFIGQLTNLTLPGWHQISIFFAVWLVFSNFDSVCFLQNDYMIENTAELHDVFTCLFFIGRGCRYILGTVKKEIWYFSGQWRKSHNLPPIDWCKSNVLTYTLTVRFSPVDS